MRIGDLDALFCQLWRKADPFKEQPLVKPSAVWSKAATMAREAPTIDPETLPIVCKLREELARVTAERDEAVKDRAKLADYELSVCEGFCFGDASHSISMCEWLVYGKCKLREWRGPQKKG